MITDEGKVGSKGELFPSKKIRQAVGFSKDMKVKYTVVEGKLIVERIVDPLEVLSRPLKVIITKKELRKNRDELSKRLEL